MSGKWEKTFEIAVPPHPEAQRKRDVDVYIYDSDGRELVNERRGFVVGGGTLRFTHHLHAGIYLLRIRDERVDGYQWPQEETEFEVPSQGTPRPVRLDFGTDTSRYYVNWQ